MALSKPKSYGRTGPLACLGTAAEPGFTPRETQTMRPELRAGQNERANVDQGVVRNIPMSIAFFVEFVRAGGNNLPIKQSNSLFQLDTPLRCLDTCAWLGNLDVLAIKAFTHRQIGGAIAHFLWMERFAGLKKK